MKVWIITVDRYMTFNRMVGQDIKVASSKEKALEWITKNYPIPDIEELKLADNYECYDDIFDYFICIKEDELF